MNVIPGDSPRLKCLYPNGLVDEDGSLPDGPEWLDLDPERLPVAQVAALNHRADEQNARYAKHARLHAEREAELQAAHDARMGADLCARLGITGVELARRVETLQARDMADKAKTSRFKV